MSNDIQPTTRAVVGIDTFFAALKGARGKITFKSGGVQAGNAADYSPLSDNMYFDSGVLKRGSFTAAGKITAMHEMVHALDDQNDWYLKWPGRNDEIAEALAYGSEFVYEASQNLSRIEKQIRDGEPCYGDGGIYENWNSFWNGVDNRRATYTVAWGNGKTRRLTTSDLVDLRNKTGLTVPCERLRVKFMDLLGKSNNPELNCGCVLECRKGLPAYFR